MKQNNRIVNGHRQLQHRCHRIRHERYIIEDKVCSHIQECCHTKYQHEDGNLHISTGRKQQNTYNNDDRDYQNDFHVILQIRCIIFIDCCIEPGIIIFQRSSYICDRCLGQTVIFRCLKGNRIKSCQILIGVSHILTVCELFFLAVIVFIILVFFIKVHSRYTLDVFQLICNRFCLIICDILHHHLCCAKGGELFIHHIQTNTRLGIIRKVIRQFLNDINMTGHDHAANRCSNENDQQKLSFVYDKLCQFSQVSSSLFKCYICNFILCCIVS